MNESWGQEFDAKQNDDKVLVFTSTTDGSILGDAHQFVLVNEAGQLQFAKTTGNGITITDPGSLTTPAVIEVDITDQLELPIGDYTWQLRRANAGREDTLAEGEVHLEQSYRDAT